jgi:hypothetical protein
VVNFLASKDNMAEVLKKRLKDAERNTKKVSKAVSKSNPLSTIGNYGANVSKSLGYAAGDYLAESLDSVVSFSEVNADFLSEMRRLIKNPTGAFKRMLGVISTEEDKQELKTLGKNMLSDLATGKFYDKNRDRSGSAMGMMASFGDEDDYWESGLEGGDSDFSDTDAMYDIADKQEESADDRTRVTVSAIGSSTKAIVENQNINHNTDLKLRLTHHAQNISAISNLSSISIAAIETQNAKFTEMNQTLSNLGSLMVSKFDETNKILAEIRDGITPKREEKVNRSERFDPERTFDIKGYLKMVSTNVDKELSITDTITAITGGRSIKELANLYQSNPLQFLVSTSIRSVMPSMLKTAMSDFNNSFKHFFNSMIMKLSNTKDEDGPLAFIAKMFRIDIDKKRSFDLSGYRKGLNEPKTLSERSLLKIEKALTDVISNQLNTIIHALTGKKGKVFDYDRGVFVNPKEKIVEISKGFNDLSSDMGDIRSYIDSRLAKIKFENVGSREKVQDDVTRYLQSLGESGDIINPFKEFNSSKMGGIDKQSWNIISAITKSMKRNELLGSNTQALSAGVNRGSRNKRRNDELLSNSLSSILNGYDDEYTELYSHVAGGKNPKEFKFKGHDYKAGGVSGSVSNILTEIRDILTNGIIVYPGGSGKGGKSAGYEEAMTRKRNLKKSYAKATEDEVKELNRKSGEDKANDEEFFRHLATLSNPDDIYQFMMEHNQKEEQKEIDKKRSERENSWFASTKVGGKLISARNTVRQAISTPTSVMTKAFDFMDRGLFKLVYGADAAEHVEMDGTITRETGSLIKTMYGHIGGAFKKTFTWLDEKWFGENGSFTKLTDNIKSKIGDKLKPYIDKAKGFMGDKFLEKFAGGNLGKSLKFGKEWGQAGFDDDPDLNMAERATATLFRGINKVTTSFSNMMLGDDFYDEEGNLQHTDSRNLWNGIKKEFKGKMGKVGGAALAGGALYGGAGLLTGLFLPGGPLLGALIGSGVGMVKSSDKLKTYLFGEEKENDDGSKFRAGGLLDKHVVDGFKKFFPAVATGVVAGAAFKNFGLWGSALIPGGPIGGALLGSLVGMISASDKMKAMLFGEEVDDGKGGKKVNEGLFSKKFQADFKKNLPKGVLGALGGAAAFAKFGIIGGPLAGAGIGLLTAFSSDNIRKYIFGGKDKDGKEQKGLLSPIFDFGKKAIVEPLGNWFNKTGHNIEEWFNTNIVKSFSDSLSPLKEMMEESKTSLKKAIGGIGESFKNSIDGVFVKHLGLPMEKFFKEKVTDPLGKAMGWLIGGIGKIIGGFLSMPFKAINAMTGKYEDNKLKKNEKEMKLNERLKRQLERDERFSEAWGKVKSFFKGNEQHNELINGVFNATRENGMLDSDYLASKEAWANTDIDRPKKIKMYNSLLKRYGNGLNISLEDFLKLDNTGIKELKTRLKLDEISFFKRRDKESKYGKFKSLYGDDFDVDLDSFSGMSSKEIKNLERKLKVARYQASKDGDDSKANDTLRERLTSEATSESARNKRNKEGDEKGENKRTMKTQEAERAKYDKDNRTSGRNFIYTRGFKRAILSMEKSMASLSADLKGQVNGAGWNLEYIKNVLTDKFGPPSQEPSGEKADGFRKGGLLSKIGIGARRLGRRAGWAMQDLGGMIGDGASAVWNSGIMSPIRGIAGAVGGAWKAGKGLVSGVGNTIGGAWEAAKGIGSVIGDALSVGFKTLTGTLDIMKEGLKEAASGIGAGLGSIASGMGDLGKYLLSGLGAVIATGGEAFKIILPELLKGGVTGVKAVAKIGYAGLKTAWNATKFVGGAALKGLANTKIGQFVTKFFEDVKDDAKSGVFGTRVHGKVDTNIIEVGGRDIHAVQLFQGERISPMPMIALPVYIAGMEKRLKGSGGGFPAMHDGEETEQAENPGGKGWLSGLFNKNYRQIKGRMKKSSDPNRVIDRAYETARTAEEYAAIDRISGKLANSQGGIVGDVKDAGNKLSGGLLGLLGAALPLINMLGAGAGFMSGNEEFGIRAGIKGITSLLPKGGRTLKHLGQFIKHPIQSLKAGKLAKGALKAKDFNKAGGIITDMASGNYGRIFGATDEAARVTRGVRQAGATVGGSRAAGKAARSAARAAVNNVDDSATIVTKVMDAVRKFLSNSAVAKFLGKGKLKFITPIINTMQTLLGKIGKSALGKVGGELLAKLGSWPVTLAMAVYDLGTGFADAANIFEIPSSEVKLNMRVAAGLAKALSGLVIVIPVSWIANPLYNLFANDADEAKMENAKKSHLEAYKSHLVDNPGTTFEEWNKNENKTFFNKFIGDPIKGTVTNIKNAVTGGAKVGGKVADGIMSMLALMFTANLYQNATGEIPANITSYAASLLNNQGDSQTASLISGLSNVRMNFGKGFSGAGVSDLASTYGEKPTSALSLARSKNSIVNTSSKAGANRGSNFGISGYNNQTARQNAVNPIVGPTSFDDFLTSASTPRMHGIPLYKQTDRQWNEGFWGNGMAASGCGPTVAAMVASAYSGVDVTPLEMNELARRNGFKTHKDGVNPEFFGFAGAKYNFKVSPGKKDATRIANETHATRPIIIMGKSTDSASPFTKEMHYMLLVTYEPRNSASKNAYVIDPLGKKTGSYSLKKVLEGTHKIMFTARADGTGVKDSIYSSDVMVELSEGDPEGEIDGSRASMDIFSYISALGEMLGNAVDIRYGFKTGDEAKNGLLENLGFGGAPPADVTPSNNTGRKFRAPKGFTGDTDVLDWFGERLVKVATYYKQKGLHITSGQRSLSEQQRLWDKRKAQYPGEPDSVTNKWVARPGTSRHHVGLAADINNSWFKDLGNEELAAFGLHKPLGHESWHVEPVETRGMNTASLINRFGVPEYGMGTGKTNITDSAIVEKAREINKTFGNQNRKLAEMKAAKQVVSESGSMSGDVVMALFEKAVNLLETIAQNTAQPAVVTAGGDGGPVVRPTRTAQVFGQALRK